MSENKHLTPVWIVYVDGRRLDTEHEGALRRISVHDRLNGISTFSMLFDTSEAKIDGKGHISHESEISIHLGYKDDIEEVFSGEVLGFRGIFPEYGSEQVEVTGANVLHKFARAARSRSFEGKPVSDIIKGLIDGYSLKAEVDDFGADHDFLSEDEQTDYEYILEAAGLYGKQVFATGNTVYVSDEITVRKDEIIYEWGKSLIQFEAAQDISSLVSEVDYIGWDSLKNESFTGSATLSDLKVKAGGSTDWTGISKGGSGKFIETRVTQRLKDIDDATQLALGALQKNSFLFGNAKGTGEGNYKLRPGMRVNIKMTGTRFEGEYIAHEVTHCFDFKNGYTTDFVLSRNMCSK
jgi:phage protein D